MSFLLKRWGRNRYYPTNLYTTHTGYIHQQALFYKPVMFSHQYHFTPFYPKKRWKMAKKASKTTKRGILSRAQFSR